VNCGYPSNTNTQPSGIWNNLIQVSGDLIKVHQGTLSFVRSFSGVVAQMGNGMIYGEVNKHPELLVLNHFPF
jgi:hypothetical protein